jgi:hypothetical protein
MAPDQLSLLQSLIETLLNVAPWPIVKQAILNEMEDDLDDLEDALNALAEVSGCDPAIDMCELR